MKNKNMFADNGKAVWGIILSIISAVGIIAVLVYFYISQAVWTYGNGSTPDVCICLQDNWERVYDDGRRENFVPDTTMYISEGETVCLEHVLNETISDKYYLQTQLSRANCRVYIDNVLRYEFFQDVTSRPYRSGLLNIGVYTPLHADDHGKTLRIELFGYHNKNYMINNFYIGEKMAIVRHYIGEKAFDICIAVFFFVLGINCIIIGFCVRIISKNQIQVDLLGWCLFLISFWNLTQSSYRDIIFVNVKGASLIPPLALMFFPLFLALYFNNLQESRYAKIYYLFMSVDIAFIVYRVVLQLRRISDLSSAVTATFVFDYVFMALAVFTIFLDGKKGLHKNYIGVCIGCAAMSVSGLIQIYFYMVDQANCSATPFSVGVAIFTLISFVHGISDIVKQDVDKTNRLVMADVKSKFFANMSHEIRTPLNAILGMNQMIIKEAEDDKIKSYADDVDNAGAMLLQIINDILDYSKLDSNMLSINEKPYILDEIILASLNMIDKNASDKKLTVIKDIDHKIPKYLKGDAIRIKQIMVNLLSNAVKYTDMGKITLRIFCEVIDETTVNLCINVADTGIGIREEDVENLFLAFKRLDESHNSKIEGTGLGLAITHELISLMNGSIDVESTYGVGSTFKVSIPQKVCSEFDYNKEIKDAIKYNRGEKGNSREKLLTKFKSPTANLLVVDDVAVNNKVFEKLIEDTESSVDSSLSGNEAIKMCRKKKYDVIFMDHMMPEKDGIETFNCIRNDHTGLNMSTPIIVLTANTSDENKELYEETGFEDTLFKPYSSDELHQKVYKFLPKSKIIG